MNHHVKSVGGVLNIAYAKELNLKQFLKSQKLDGRIRKMWKKEME